MSEKAFREEINKWRQQGVELLERLGIMENNSIWSNLHILSRQMKESTREDDKLSEYDFIVTIEELKTIFKEAEEMVNNKPQAGQMIFQVSAPMENERMYLQGSVNLDRERRRREREVRVEVVEDDKPNKIKPADNPVSVAELFERTKSTYERLKQVQKEYNAYMCKLPKPEEFKGVCGLNYETTGAPKLKDCFNCELYIEYFREQLYKETLNGIPTREMKEHIEKYHKIVECVICEKKPATICIGCSNPLSDIKPADTLSKSVAELLKETKPGYEQLRLAERAFFAYMCTLPKPEECLGCISKPCAEICAACIDNGHKEERVKRAKKDRQ